MGGLRDVITNTNTSLTNTSLSGIFSFTLGTAQTYRGATKGPEAIQSSHEPLFMETHIPFAHPSPMIIFPLICILLLQWDHRGVTDILFTIKFPWFKLTKEEELASPKETGEQEQLFGGRVALWPEGSSRRDRQTHSYPWPGQGETHLGRKKKKEIQQLLNHYTKSFTCWRFF